MRGEESFGAGRSRDADLQHVGVRWWRKPP